MVLVMISSTTYDVISLDRLHSIKLQYHVMMKTKERRKKENTEDITKNNNVDGEE